MIVKAYKFRIYPKKKQKHFLNQTMGCCRWFWNYSLAKIKDAEKKITKETTEEEKKEIRKNISVYAISKELPLLKKDEKTSFLKNAISISLIKTLRDLDAARSNYFRNLKNGLIEKKRNSYINHRKKKGLEVKKEKLFDIGKPKFKSKGHRQTCSFHQGYSIDFENGIINIPKCEKVRAVFHRRFNGISKTVTIERTPSGKYFAAIQVHESGDFPLKPEIKKNTTVGIHNGIKNFVTSDEMLIEKTNRFLRNSLTRLKVLQRRLSRKKEKSHRWDRQRIQIALLHEKIANQRNYLLHEVANVIVKNPKYKTICLESWEKQEMMRNRVFAQAIQDVSWEKLLLYIKYKCEWEGKNVLELPPVTANAKTCNICNHLNEWVELKDREWECEKCGSHHTREFNCAKNTKAMCLKEVGIK